MSSETITMERDGHLLLIGLNRPAKRNALNLAMLADLAHAYESLESDDRVRAGVLFAHGDHFTAGLDLLEVAPAIAAGRSPFEGGRDPFRLDGSWTKPVVAAVQGRCLTLGIELVLAADIRIAAASARFAQIEVRRGIFPFGGATIRWPRQSGWGDAMRWLLTGDEFGAEEAHRIGLVQEVAPDAETAVARAREIAHTIAERSAPLGVRATLESAQRAQAEGDSGAVAQLGLQIRGLFGTADAAEGVQSFVERRDAHFQGS